MAFSAGDYDPIRDGMIRSAHTVVPEILRTVNPASVVDVGCGTGLWLAEFARLGVPRIRGYDGHDGSRLDIPADRYVQVDLASKNVIDGRYHLAVCLEVAEHLPPERAGWLVETLCSLAPAVLFSAAVPGQGGQGHVNEQWPSFWAQMFYDLGFLVSGALRWRWWDQVPHGIEPWYAQNLLLCADQELVSERPLLQPLFRSLSDGPHPVVHPFYLGNWSAS